MVNRYVLLDILDWIHFLAHSKQYSANLSLAILASTGFGLLLLSTTDLFRLLSLTLVGINVPHLKLLSAPSSLEALL